MLDASTAGCYVASELSRYRRGRTAEARDAIHDGARHDLFGYIDGFHNSHRLHSAIGYRSPAEMERIAA